MPIRLNQDHIEQLRGGLKLHGHARPYPGLVFVASANHNLAVAVEPAGSPHPATITVTPDGGIAVACAQRGAAKLLEFPDNEAHWTAESAVTRELLLDVLDETVRGDVREALEHIATEGVCVLLNRDVRVLMPGTRNHFDVLGLPGTPATARRPRHLRTHGIWL